ncbi:MAG: hypothetical protein JHC12_04155 [Thermogladius sp.]|nr:hypothetical protein [Thermogladius sp.]
MGSKYPILGLSIALILLLVYHFSVVAGLNNEINSLKDEKSRYQLEVEELNATLTQLSGSYEALQARYNELEGEYNNTVNWLNGNVTFYQQLVSEYRENISLLESYLQGNLSYYKEMVSWLEGNLSYYKSLTDQLSFENQLLKTWLQGNQTYLLNQVIVLADELHALRTRVSTPLGVATLIGRNTSFVNSFLSLNVELARGLDLQLPQGDIVSGIVNYTAVNFYYEFDPVALDDYWKPVNETIADRGGDCEDLALFIYSYLYSRGLNHTYLIAFKSGEYGHVAVVTNVNGSWVLIDPAGDWVNGYNLFIRFTVSNDSDRGVVRVPPLLLSPFVKSWMLGGNLAELTWEESMYMPSNNSLISILTSWSSYWSGMGYPQEAYYVVGYNTYYSTSSLSDLAGYLSRLASA